jgi:hypothetical protein
MGQYLLFSLTAAANPTLIAATTVLLLTDRPRTLMSGYLLGAYTMSITIGLVIVFALQDTSAVSTAKRTLSPALDIALGAVLLVLAFVLVTSRDRRVVESRRAKREAKPDTGPPKWQRALSGGSPRAAFVGGALLTLPGASYVAALGAVVKLDESTVVTVLLVLLTNLIMLLLIEVPLLGYILRPDSTPAAVERAKAWVGRHIRRAATIFLLVIGSLLVLRGLLQLH